MAKIHAAPNLESGQLTRAMDDLDDAIRAAFPLVAAVFIDMTSSHLEAEASRGSR